MNIRTRWLFGGLALAAVVLLGVALSYGPLPIRLLVRAYSDVIRGIPVLILIFAFRSSAALGYAYLALLLGLVVVLVWAGVWILLNAPLNAGVIKILLLLGVFAGTLAISILRGLFARIPEPEGVRLARGDAPALFAEVDAISRELGVKPVSRTPLRPSPS